MRIIAGKYKSRLIKQAKGTQTRPTADKIKEAVFHKMGPYFEGGQGLDLFAGSGNLGIEAISRGFDHMTFIDNAPNALRAIRDNCKILPQETYEIYKNDCFRALKVLARKKKVFDAIFIDPPYDSKYYEKLFNEIIKHNLLANKGLLYIEYQYDMTYYFPSHYHTIFEKRYSEATAVLILQKHEEEVD